MGITYKQKLYEKLEALGEQEVREKLALGAFASNKVASVKLWLEKR